MNNVFNDVQKIMTINMNSASYLVYAIPNYDNYSVYTSKIIKFNNVINLVDIDNSEKDLVINVIKTIFKLKDASMLSEYLNKNNISLN